MWYTLYPASCNLFDQVDQRIGAFIADLLQVDAAEAKRLQKHYFSQYGTTLRGLMDHHGIAPGTAWEDVPDDWCCPDCGATKADFALLDPA